MPAALRDSTKRDGLFASTRWTLVREAAQSRTSSPQALSALSELCEIYWRPVYLFLRRQGIAPHDAQDFTQGFFAELIESRSYARAEPSKGRFRSYLLGALKHFVADERARAGARKRGGGMIAAPLDESAISQGETQVARWQTSNADHAYEREWAAALLRQVIERLEQESRLAGKDSLFSALRPHLVTESADATSYGELAARLGRPATTLRSDVARFRARYRAILREEVRGTVNADEEVDEELRHLREVIST